MLEILAMIVVFYAAMILIPLALALIAMSIEIAISTWFIWVPILVLTKVV